MRALLLLLASAGVALAQPAPPVAPSPILQGALRSYESGDYHTASRELHRAAEGEGQDSTANRQRAEFFLMKALYHLGFHVVALTYLRKIVERSASPYREACLKWALALSSKLSDELGTARLAARLRGELAKPALAKDRFEATILVARGLAQLNSQLEEGHAIDLLREVPATSSARGRARRYLGILLARRQELDRARGALGEALSLLEKERGPAASELRERTLLHLARAAWVAGARSTSLTYYSRLPASSRFGPEATFLRAFRAFETGDARRATEELHRLHGLRFSHLFFPEGLILRAAIYLREGKLDRAEEAVKAFDRGFRTLRGHAQALLAKKIDPTDLPEAMRRRAKAAADPEERRTIAAALDDASVREPSGIVAGLDRELAAVRNAPPAWKATAVAGVVLQELTLMRSLMVHESGSAIQRWLERIVFAIGSVDNDVDTVRAAITRCRAVKGRATVEVKLRPRLGALFDRDGLAVQHFLFYLEVKFGGCGRSG